MGDGPRWQLVELYAGISAFMFAAQCLRQPVSLHSFSELQNSAAKHTEARYDAKHLGPAETAQFERDPVDMATVTFECTLGAPAVRRRQKGRRSTTQCHNTHTNSPQGVRPRKCQRVLHRRLTPEAWGILQIRPLHGSSRVRIIASDDAHGLSIGRMHLAN